MFAAYYGGDAPSGTGGRGLACRPIARGGIRVGSETILQEIEEFSSLGAVIRWSMSRVPRAEFIDVIVQDEYHHDVIVHVSDTVYAVFETS
jgi:hypothetical protein